MLKINSNLNEKKWEHYKVVAAIFIEQIPIDKKSDFSQIFLYFICSLLYLFDLH